MAVNSEMNRWLVKTEPAECGIDDFARQPTRSIRWDGVRNYQARNHLRSMRPGDQVFIYHSSCKRIGIAGIVAVTQAAYPDPAQFDPDSPWFDPNSTADQPRWSAVDMQYVARFPALIPLEQLKSMPELQDLALVRRGSRLSVMPVSANEWQAILALSEQPPAR